MRDTGCRPVNESALGNWSYTARNESADLRHAQAADRYAAIAVAQKENPSLMRSSRSRRTTNELMEVIRATLENGGPLNTMPS